MKGLKGVYKHKPCTRYEGNLRPDPCSSSFSSHFAAKILSRVRVFDFSASVEMLGSEGELSSGYKLVPWSSWEQWRFVRESIFSSSPDSASKALRRISAWGRRGCLPVPIDVTAAIVEI